MNGLDCLGATTVYTDRPTVQKVELALLALPSFRQDPLFQAVNADGTITPASINAVARFNQLYGTASDGGTITDATLAALKTAAVDNRTAMGPAPAPDNRPMFGPALPPNAPAKTPGTTPAAPGPASLASAPRTPLQVLGRAMIGVGGIVAGGALGALLLRSHRVLGGVGGAMLIGVPAAYGVGKYVDSKNAEKGK